MKGCILLFTLSIVFIDGFNHHIDKHAFGRGARIAIRETVAENDVSNSSDISAYVC